MRDIGADGDGVPTETLSRRQALRKGLLTAAVVGVAGCTSRGRNSTETAEHTSTETAVATSTEPTEQSSTATATTTPVQFEPLAIPQGSVDVADLSTLGDPQVTIADFDVWLGDVGEGDVWLRWDSETFSFAADVTNTIFERFIGTEDTIWKNDAFQLALAPEPPDYAEAFVGLSFSDTYQGPLLWHGVQPGGDDSRPITDVDARVQHFPEDGDGRTEFAFVVPWTELGLEFDPAVGEDLSLTLVHHDWQKQEGEHWRNYGGGMLGEKTPSKLGSATLVA